jgi:hypothetical protein
MLILLDIGPKPGSRHDDAIATEDRPQSARE